VTLQVGPSRATPGQKVVVGHNAEKSILAALSSVDFSDVHDRVIPVDRVPRRLKRADHAYSRILDDY
jgi:hypothetical protein